MSALCGVTPCEHGGEGYPRGGVGADAQVVFRVQFLKRLEVSQEIRQVLRPGIGNSGLLFAVFKPLLNGLVVESATASAVQEPGSHPVQSGVLHNFPNPFNGATTVRYELSQRSAVTVRILDASGRVVRNLYGGTLHAGPYEMQWDARDDGGSSVASGVYYAQIATEGGTQTREVTVLR